MPLKEYLIRKRLKVEKMVYGDTYWVLDWMSQTCLDASQFFFARYHRAYMEYAHRYPERS